MKVFSQTIAKKVICKTFLPWMIPDIWYLSTPSYVGCYARLALKQCRLKLLQHSTSVSHYIVYTHQGVTLIHLYGAINKHNQSVVIIPQVCI